jgi:hypothetical protein
MQERVCKSGHSFTCSGFWFFPRTKYLYEPGLGVDFTAVSLSSVLCVRCFIDNNPSDIPTTICLSLGYGNEMNHDDILLESSIFSGFPVRAIPYKINAIKKLQTKQ